MKKKRRIDVVKNYEMTWQEKEKNYIFIKRFHVTIENDDNHKQIKFSHTHQKNLRSHNQLFWSCIFVYSEKISALYTIVTLGFCSLGECDSSKFKILLTRIIRWFHKKCIIRQHHAYWKISEKKKLLWWHTHIMILKRLATLKITFFLVEDVKKS